MLEYGKAICYSGYREGQCPWGEIPTKEQIEEDLMLLVREGYRYLRMYDPNGHAERVLELIKEKNLPLRCLIGVDNAAEVNNPDCPWDKTVYSEEELEANRKRNDAEVEKLIALVRKYPEEVVAVSVGNENTPDWGAKIVPEERLVRHAKRLKEALGKPVTFCEGASDWLRLKKLVKEVDILGIHSYPLHYGTAPEQALSVNQKDFAAVSEAYPDKYIMFTELGWSTRARDAHKKDRAGEEIQKQYIKEISKWFEQDKIIGFIFEAFDEPWKGETQDSCERNWGLFYVDRTPKPVIRK